MRPNTTETVGSMNTSPKQPQNDLPLEQTPSSTDREGEDVSPTAGERTESGDSQMSLEEQVDALQAERDAFYDQRLRAQAELENFRKRARKENEQTRLYGLLPLVRDLLPGLDNLRRTLSAAEESHNIDQLIEGVQMVLKQFEDMLARHAVVPIEAVGQPFDPNRHEAVQHLPSADYPPMTVLQELERGYMLHDRVVRPGKVIVSSGPEESEADTTD